MQMHIPLHRRGAGVGCREPEDPPRRLTPSAPPERIFMGVSHVASGGGTAYEKFGPSRDRKGAVEAICLVPPSLTVGASDFCYFHGVCHVPAGTPLPTKKIRTITLLDLPDRTFSARRG